MVKLHAIRDHDDVDDAIGGDAGTSSASFFSLSQPWGASTIRPVSVAEAAHSVGTASIEAPDDPRFDTIHIPSDLAEPGIGSAYGAGHTALIKQTYNSSLSRWDFTGNTDVDAVLIGSRWTLATLTYSFPSSGSLYAGQGYAAGKEPSTQTPFNDQQQAAARYAFGLISSYTNLKFQEVTETATTHANIRISQTDYSGVGSAYGNFPSSSAQSGDIWFGTTGQPFYTTPAVGNWGQATIMHEIGHTMGLKHGMSDYTNDDLTATLGKNPDGSERYGSVALPADHNGQDWSLMTYNPDPATGQEFEGDQYDQPETYMQDDIAALQYLYGANFTTNSTNTVYKWSPTTGQEFINGVGQAMPEGNKISMTIWDGNGNDTYDLSNYSTNLSIDLDPGAFSTFSSAQLVNHRAVTNEYAPAVGNVANALLYNGDTRSLIENAVGGNGSDRIVGNVGANTLVGNGGNDTLIGGAGNDVLKGGAGTDILYGDGIAAKASGVVLGSGSIVKYEGEGNSSFASAIDITDSFSLASNSDIGNSTTVPHVTISGSGDQTYDYYSVTVAAGATITLDIDNTVNLDSLLRLGDSNGNVLAFNDDGEIGYGGAGSTTATDSYLTYTTTTAGTYYIEVSQHDSGTTLYGDPLDYGQSYDLQVSVANVAAVGAGTPGNDTLDGGVGADTMVGGAGNDTYYVDNAGDLIYEAANGGTDLVHSTISYTLGANVENLTLDGGAAINGTGNALANTLTGNGAANILNGGAGADTMVGGAGDDIYYVDNAGDKVVEAANGGSDRVLASVSYVLPAGQEIERLTTDSFSGTAPINLTGNEFANVIQGNAGNNVLNGGGGADNLYGFGGNDTYVVDNAKDQVHEAVGGGTDRVLASVSYVLAAGQEIETLTTSYAAGTGAINLTGNEFANLIQGNAGANVLDGKLGLDVLTGLGGADTFLFDTALSTANVDTITDFANSTNAVHDVMRLAHSIFATLPTGALAATAFVDLAVAGAIETAADRIIYNHTSGALYYDDDGSGHDAQIQFATLSSHVALSAADFIVA